MKDQITSFIINSFDGKEGGDDMIVSNTDSATFPLLLPDSFIIPQSVSVWLFRSISRCNAMFARIEPIHRGILEGKNKAPFPIGKGI